MTAPAQLALLDPSRCEFCGRDWTNVFVQVDGQRRMDLAAWLLLSTDDREAASRCWRGVCREEPAR